MTTALTFSTQSALLTCTDDTLHVDDPAGFYLGDMTHDAARQLIAYIAQATHLPGVTDYRVVLDIGRTHANPWPPIQVQQGSAVLIDAAPRPTDRCTRCNVPRRPSISWICPVNGRTHDFQPASPK